MELLSQDQRNVFLRLSKLVDTDPTLNAACDTDTDSMGEFRSITAALAQPDYGGPRAVFLRAHIPRLCQRADRSVEAISQATPAAKVIHGQLLDALHDLRQRYKLVYTADNEETIPSEDSIDLDMEAPAQSWEDVLRDFAVCHSQPCLLSFC
jgi:hypothetical protein